MADRRNKLVTDVEVNTDKAEGGLKDLGRAADRASVDVDKLARELRQAKAPAQDLGREADHAGHVVGDAMDNSKDSVLGASSAMGEAFGQGGSATDAIGSFGEVVESIAEAFGPLGPAVALAGGAILGMFAASAQKAEELKQKAHDVFDALIEGQGRLDEAYKKQAIAQFIKDHEELVTQVGQLLGPGGLKELGDAVGGNDAAYQKLNHRVEVRLDAMKREKKDLEALTLAGTPLTKQQSDQLQLLNQQIPVYEDLNTQIDENAGVIGQARHELQLNNAMTGTATSSMGAYSSSVKASSEELKGNIGWVKEQARQIRAAAGATDEARASAELYIQAMERRARRGTAPPGAVAFDETSGKWLGRNGQPVRAAGGPVTAGQAYTVGEYGKETFIPATDGTIVPGTARGAGSVVVNQTILSSDPARVARDTARALRRAQFRGG